MHSTDVGPKRIHTCHNNGTANLADYVLPKSLLAKPLVKMQSKFSRISLSIHLWSFPLSRALNHCGINVEKFRAKTHKLTQQQSCVITGDYGTYVTPKSYRGTILDAQMSASAAHLACKHRLFKVRFLAFKFKQLPPCVSWPVSLPASMNAP